MVDIIDYTHARNVQATTLANHTRPDNVSDYILYNYAQISTEPENEVVVSRNICTIQGALMFVHKHIDYSRFRMEVSSGDTEKNSCLITVLDNIDDAVKWCLCFEDGLNHRIMFPGELIARKH